MNYSLGPDSAGVGQLVSHAATTLTRSTAAGDGRAVEIALAVKRDALVRLASVGASGKAIENSVSCSIGSGCHLKGRARAELTALNGRTIDVPRPVHYQIRVD